MTSEKELLANAHPAIKALRRFFHTNISNFALGASLAKRENPQIYIGMALTYDVQQTRFVPKKFQFHILPFAYPAGIMFSLEGHPPNFMPTAFLEVKPEYVKPVTEWIKDAKYIFNMVAAE